MEKSYRPQLQIFKGISRNTVDGHFIGGGNRSTWRKPQTCYKSATNFITQCRQFDVSLIPNQTHFLE
jgi:hypothetical protein